MHASIFYSYVCFGLLDWSICYQIDPYVCQWYSITPNVNSISLTIPWLDYKTMLNFYYLSLKGSVTIFCPKFLIVIL